MHPIMVAVTICLGSAIVMPCIAQTTAQLSPAASANAATTPPITPFQYIASPKWKEPDPSKAVKRLGTALSIESLYRDGDYKQVAEQGTVYLESNKGDDELRLWIANSLAWTGQLKPAVALYDGLTKSEFRGEAELGLANINRWNGSDHLALIIYKSILKNEPDNADAKEGLRLALREIRPRATVRFGGSKDSADTLQHNIILNARWRDETNTSVWEVETSNDQLRNTVIRAKGTELSVRYRLLETPYKPRFEIGVDKNNVYANVGVEFDTLPIKLDVGRVNWGKLSANPLGLASGLSAIHAGAQLNLPTKYGKLFVSADGFHVSDGNTITSSTLRFTPTWQPLGSHVKFFGGIETRSAKFASLSYWSPTEGYGSAFAGISGEWGDSEWDVTASAQVGNRLWGEAGRNWSAALTAKRWVTSDIAVGVNLWAMASKRGFQQYADRSIYFSVEKLW